MTNLRRTSKLVSSVALAAVALWAAVVGLDALISWRFNAEPSPERQLEDYLALAALSLAALVGIMTMLRRAIAALAAAPTHGRRSAEIARLVNEARTDSLTRLANHRAFRDDLALEIDRRNTTGSVFSLMALDLDGLKGINDTLGHQAGDAHIVRIAQALQAEVGASGTVYRTGGDEFMILLPQSRNWHAINLAHKIHAATGFPTGSRALSIGVTETKGTEHRQVLVRQADLALYEAKRAKLAIVPYQPGLDPGPAKSGAGRLSSHQKALAAALARTVDARDLGTSNHSEMVAELAAGMAAYHGIEGQRLERLRVAALLHDVGKIGVSDAILHKRAALGEGERSQMREHVTVGRDILVAAGFVSEATWVLHHHEHYDGTGYPHGLSGAEIPLESRIIAVADAFEAMTARRPYQEPLTNEQALAELAALGGTQFDPACVRAVAEAVEGAPPPTPPEAPPRGSRRPATDQNSRPTSVAKLASA